MRVFASSELSTLRDYIDVKFSKQLNISDAQTQQLTWIMGHKRRSYDMDAEVADPYMHIEVVRALTRLYCLQLLKSGTERDYLNFISAQLDAKVASPLTFNSFKKLSKHIQKLDAVDHELLETATILSAVSLSDQAFKLAQGLVNLENSSNDNLAFLTTTVRVDDDIYPLIRQIKANHQMTKKLLYILFPPQTNFRHMLYTEGGASMFKYLRTMIKHQYITADEMDLWYAHWVVNIAGFRGHVANSGSLYLTEPVFQAMDKLYSLTTEMLQTPNFNPLASYLEYRAEILGYSTLPQEERLFLAHLGAMLRLYNPSQGKDLYTGFYALPKRLRDDLQKDFLVTLNDYQGNTPTYFPALLGNTMLYVDNDIKLTLELILPIYSYSLQKYARLIDTGALSNGAALSFNQLSAKKNIAIIVKLKTIRSSDIRVNANGEVELSI